MIFYWNHFEADSFHSELSLAALITTANAKKARIKQI